MLNCKLQDIINATRRDERISVDFYEEIAIDTEQDDELLEDLEDLLKDF